MSDSFLPHVTNLLDIHSREELYRWYQENHDKVSGFWLRVNRAAEDCPGVVRYIDAVEVALCFGWIDSTLKSIDDGKPVQHFTPRRKRSNLESPSSTPLKDLAISHDSRVMTSSPLAMRMET